MQEKILEIGSLFLSHTSLSFIPLESPFEDVLEKANPSRRSSAVQTEE